MTQRIAKYRDNYHLWLEALPNHRVWRKAALGLLLLLIAATNALAMPPVMETPVRGLSCLRSSSAISPHSLPVDLATGPALVEKVYIPYPAVVGPQRSIRALRANFKPFWLDLVVADEKALDPLCLIGVNQSGHLHRLDAEPGILQTRRGVDVREQVAAQDFDR